MRFLSPWKRALPRIEVFLIFFQDVRPCLPPIGCHPGAALKRETFHQLDKKSTVRPRCFRIRQELCWRPGEYRLSCHQPSQNIDDREEGENDAPRPKLCQDQCLNVRILVDHSPALHQCCSHLEDIRRSRLRRFVAVKFHPAFITRGVLGTCSGALHLAVSGLYEDVPS